MAEYTDYYEPSSGCFLMAFDSSGLDATDVEVAYAEARAGLGFDEYPGYGTCYSDSSGIKRVGQLSDWGNGGFNCASYGSSAYYATISRLVTYFQGVFDGTIKSALLKIQLSIYSNADLDFSVAVKHLTKDEFDRSDDFIDSWANLLQGTLIDSILAGDVSIYPTWETFSIDVTNYITSAALLDGLYFSFVSSNDIAEEQPTPGNATCDSLWIKRLNAAQPSASFPRLEITYDAYTPDIVTYSATDITATTANLNSFLNNAGGKTGVESPTASCYFEWGETEAYGSTTTPEDKYTHDTIQHQISGLTSGKTYHFRAVATNTYGTDYGLDMTFGAGEESAVESVERVSYIIRRYYKGDRSYTTEVGLGGMSSAYPFPVATPASIPAVISAETTSAKAIYSAFTCVYCRKRFSTFDELSQHLLQAHSVGITKVV